MALPNIPCKINYSTSESCSSSFHLLLLKSTQPILSYVIKTDKQTLLMVKIMNVLPLVL